MSRWELAAAILFTGLCFKLLYREFEIVAQPKSAQAAKAIEARQKIGHHALNEDITAATWVLLHLPLSYFIFLLGSTTAVGSGDASRYQVRGVAVGAVVLLLTWMHMLHTEDPDKCQRVRKRYRMAVRHIMGALCVAWGWFGWDYDNEPHDLAFWNTAGLSMLLALVLLLDGYMSGPPGSIFRTSKDRIAEYRAAKHD